MEQAERELKEQIQMNMKKAYRKLISETFSNETLSQKDIEWIVDLCKELKFRINQLTPSRQDLHKELDASFDITLIQQMLTHNSFEKQDLIPIVTILHSRIASLCAPVQDKHVSSTFQKIQEASSIGTCIELIIIEINEILDVIYDLNEQINKNLNSQS